MADEKTGLFRLAAGKLTLRKEILEMITYSLIGFVVPFFFKRPQELIGIIINTVLVLAALNLRGWRLLPVIIFPSIGTVLGSYFFGDMTFVVLLFVPFLWFGNAVLVAAFKYFYLARRINFFLTLFIGAVAKYLFLAITAYLFIIYRLAPDLFLASMGKIQLITAIIGGIIAFLIANRTSK